MQSLRLSASASNPKLNSTNHEMRYSSARKNTSFFYFKTTQRMLKFCDNILYKTPFPQSLKNQHFRSFLNASLLIFVTKCTLFFPVPKNPKFGFRWKILYLCSTNVGDLTRVAFFISNTLKIRNNFLKGIKTFLQGRKNYLKGKKFKNLCPENLVSTPPKIHQFSQKNIVNRC